MSMAAAMVASIIPDMGIVAKAAGTPRTREDETIIYAVDCGDLDPATVPEDGPLGNTQQCDRSGLWYRQSNRLQMGN